MTASARTIADDLLSPLGRLVRAGDPDRFYSAMFAPPDLRERLFALYAFNLEVARIPAVVSEPMIGEIRLQWWREAIEEIYAGSRVRAHEVVTPLADMIRDADLPRAHFDALIDARTFDIYAAPMPDFTALGAYLDATSGGLMALAAQVLSGCDVDAVAREFGAGLGAANLLRAVPALISCGKIPIPPVGSGSALDQNAIMGGVTTPDLARVVNRMAMQGAECLARARAQRAEVPRRAAPAFLAGWRASGILRHYSSKNINIFNELSQRNDAISRIELLARGLTGRW